VNRLDFFLHRYRFEDFALFDRFAPFGRFELFVLQDRLGLSGFSPVGLCPWSANELAVGIPFFRPVEPGRFFSLRYCQPIQISENHLTHLLAIL
jgi:hypothetical protein